MNIAAKLQTPLQQLLKLEERVRQAGVCLPDEGDLKQKFHGIKCVINGMKCIINMQVVAEVINERQVTTIPGTAGWIEGIINYRGVLVPVYRPGELLIPAAEEKVVPAPNEGPLMVIRRDRKGMEFSAIRADRVFSIEKFREESLQMPEKTDSRPDSLACYADEIISSDGENWYLLNTTRLLDMMATRHPAPQ